MNLLDLIPGQYKKSGLKNGGEYSGSCPWCGDGGKGNRSDRFHIWPEQGSHGTYWCRMCGKAGDAIKYLVDHDGMDFKAALNHLGLDPSILGPKKDKVPAGWQPSAVSAPADIWTDKAGKFAYWCHDRLLERPDEIGWLADRGIGIEMVKKYRLGWNPTHAWREGSAWGVTMQHKPDGKLKKLWLPRGLVIPLFSDITDSAKVLRLRIRQPDQGPRYMVIPGSSREPMCSRAEEAMIVVESELDAILLDGLAGDLVGVVAMGNDTAKPTATLQPALSAALTILVSLDSDLPKYNQETGNMDMPGAKASRWWLEQFPHACRVPIIGGKDPGEAYQAGVNLRSWILAALPPYFRVKADLDAARKKKQEQEIMHQELPIVSQKVDIISQQPEIVSPKQTIVHPDPVLVTAEREQLPEKNPDTPSPVTPLVTTVTLKNGRSFSMTSDRDEWERLTDSGEVVFSEHELKRLHDACRNMSSDERLAAAMLVLDAKEIFAPAWIRRGVAIENSNTDFGI